MIFDTKKTVCMVFASSSRNRIIANKFPALTLAGTELVYVEQFKYRGHIIDNKLSDSSDIVWEIKSMFTRTNILLRRFKHCSASSFFHHHHLFLKRPFLPCSAKVRRLP